MVPSPKVPTYDKQPEMSAQGVADKVAELVRAGEHEFIMCNFAPPDMVSLKWVCTCNTLSYEKLGWTHGKVRCSSQSDHSYGCRCGYDI
jgi:hypothetical protein